MNLTYIVYADVMFLWSFLLNLAGYKLTKVLFDKGISRKRLFILSAFTAALEVAIFVVSTNNIILYQILYSALHLIMLILFFNLRDFRSILVVFTVSFLFSGALLYFIGKKQRNIIFCAFFLAFVFVLFIFLLCFTSSKKEIRQNTCEVFITALRNEIRLKAYYDSGNLLTDPFTNNPVIILDSRELIKLFDNFKEISAGYRKYGFFNYEEAFSLTGIKFYPISYKTISNSIGIMPAFKLKALRFEGENNVFDNVIAGICRNELTLDNSYTVLLNQKLKPIREENSND